MKLPISLCTVTYNSDGRLKNLIEKHRDLVSEIVVIDQGSTDGTWEVAEEMADFSVRKRTKGFAEPDRGYLFQLAKYPYILMLDDDEELPEETKKALPDVLKLNMDIIWLVCKHWVEGVDISDVLGKEYHPRIFKPGSVHWENRMHTFPQGKQGAKTLYTELCFDHIRQWDKMVASNRAREEFTTPDKVAAQNQFIEAVRAKLASQGVVVK